MLLMELNGHIRGSLELSPVAATQLSARGHGSTHDTGVDDLGKDTQAAVDDGVQARPLIRKLEVSVRPAVGDATLKYVTLTICLHDVGTLYSCWARDVAEVLGLTGLKVEPIEFVSTVTRKMGGHLETNSDVAVKADGVIGPVDEAAPSSVVVNSG